MALDARQIDCNGCGAKVDIHAGLRTKTFVCEYCGSVCDGQQVLAVQQLQEQREKYKPWSHLRLGMTAEFLGHEYQIIGRLRSEEKTWWWDEWFMYSKSGFPLWLQEQEGGYTIFRVFYPTYPVNTNRPEGSRIKLDDRWGHAVVKERGSGSITFIEGELTWTAMPGEQFNYMDCYKGTTRFSVESSDNEIQFLRGETRDAQQIYQLFGIQEAVPPPPTFEDADDWDEDSDEWDEDSDAWESPVAADAEPMGVFSKIFLGLLLLIALGLVIMSFIGNGLSKHVKSYTFNARAATAKDDGVFLTDRKGEPIPIKLPKSSGAYELRLASTSLGASGVAGGYCWWAQVDILKEKPAKKLLTATLQAVVGDVVGTYIEQMRARYRLPKRIKASTFIDVDVKGKDFTVTLKRYKHAIELASSIAASAGKVKKSGKPGVTITKLDKGSGKISFRINPDFFKQEMKTLDPDKRLDVVHRVSTWFGRYWGIDEGERWNENNFVQSHYFRTRDPGPYYLQFYTGNCADWSSIRKNPVKRASLTVAIYKDVWMTRWTLIGGLVLLGLVILVLVWRFRSIFSDD